MNIDYDWRPEEPDFPGRAWPDGLHVPLSINGLPMHLFAIQVKRDEDGIFQATDPSFADDLEAICAMQGASPAAVELPGCDGLWVIAAHPHSD